LKLCLKETEAEMKLVADEIASRSDKKWSEILI
jgi:hypothetical protein